MLARHLAAFLQNQNSLWLFGSIFPNHKHLVIHHR
jgi:hypothetical protein